MPQINELVKECHRNAKEKGFWEDIEALDKDFNDALYTNAITTRLALIQSEVSEAVESLRESNIDNFFEELADICIRVFDLAGHFEEDLDLEDEILVKMLKNKKRPYKHGKKF